MDLRSLNQPGVPGANLRAGVDGSPLASGQIEAETPVST